MTRRTVPMAYPRRVNRELEVRIPKACGPFGTNETTALLRAAFEGWGYIDVLTAGTCIAVLGVNEIRLSALDNAWNGASFNVCDAIAQLDSVGVTVRGSLVMSMCYELKAYLIEVLRRGELF